VELAYSGTRWHGMPAMAVVVRDITQRKREEEAAHRQQQNLMRMDKLSSLGVLAAGLAHEINVPNQVILSNASLLSRAAPDLGRALASALHDSRTSLLAGLEVSEFLERLPGVLSAITTSAALIDGIIHGLRDFSAESAATDTPPFDVNDAIRGAVHLVGAYLRRATDRFSMDLDPGLPRVRGGSQRMQQVFINLILNSCQSLDSRGRAISVSSRLDTSRPSVCVTVHDEGVGITPEDLPHVREQFFTTRAAVGGTGLGLYVSQQIVTAHGGTLELRSTPGAGTDAVITLPVEVTP
jgi:polar amino acid transport system substrate-binding protein